MYVHVHIFYDVYVYSMMLFPLPHAVIQTAQASVGTRGEDHREVGEAAEVGAREKKETETPGNTIYHTSTCIHFTCNMSH